MLELIILFFIALVIYFDLKARIIPDSINFFFMFLAIALTIITYGFDLGFLLGLYAPFFLLNLAFAYLLYRLGVWAGGDVKFFTAIMAFLPLYAPFKVFSAFSIFLTSAILLVPITMIYYMDDLILFRRDLRRTFIFSIINAAKSTVFSFVAIMFFSWLIGRYNSPALILFFIIVSFLVKIPFKLALPLLLVGFLFVFQLEQFLYLIILLFGTSFLLHFLRDAFSLIANKVLTKPIVISELKEGEIPAETFYMKGGKLMRWSPKEAFAQAKGLIAAGKKISIKGAYSSLRPRGRIIVDALKARGVSLDEIKQLKRLRVKEILIKESLPFAPVIAAAFLAYKYVDVLALFGIK
jgi:Flp pilus assembly protein protease CpaA